LHVEPFFGLWNFLRRTSTKSYGRIEVNPLAPWRVHEKSQRCPIQPYYGVCCTVALDMRMLGPLALLSEMYSAL
jgi:hypothetical protein